MTPQRGQAYSTREFQFIQREYPQHGPRYCAEKLGRPLSSIQNFAKKHRIRKLYPRERFAQLSEPRSATS